MASRNRRTQGRATSRSRNNNYRRNSNPIGRSTRERRTNANPLFKNYRLIEPPIQTNSLLDIFKGTLYFSMKQYWEVPGEIAIISTILDPRLKKLRFFEEEEDIANAITKLRSIWNTQNNQINTASTNEDQQQLAVSSGLGFFEDIFDDSNQEREEISQDEISSYLQLPIEKKIVILSDGGKIEQLFCQLFIIWQKSIYLYQLHLYQVNACFLMQECIYQQKEHV